MFIIGRLLCGADLYGRPIIFIDVVPMFIIGRLLCGADLYGRPIIFIDVVPMFTIGRPTFMVSR
jgi:hypothetical protein